MDHNTLAARIVQILYRKIKLEFEKILRCLYERKGIEILEA